MKFKLINHGGGIGGFQNVQEVLRQEIADTDGTHCAFIIKPLQRTPAFRYQRLPIRAGEGQDALFQGGQEYGPELKPLAIVLS